MEHRFLDRPESGAVGRVARWARNLLASLGLLVLVIMLTPLDFWWAHAYAGSVTLPKGEVLIVLSAANDDHGFISYSSYWRARYALLAWRTGQFRAIVVSGGGSGGIRDFLMGGGVPDSDILIEPASSSTRENAVNTARLVKDLPGRKVLLTSDFHIFRAKRTFAKAGVPVEPAPAPDAMKAAEHWNGRLPAFETLVVETGKIVYYELHGWI